MLAVTSAQGCFVGGIFLVLSALVGLLWLCSRGPKCSFCARRGGVVEHVDPEQPDFVSRRECTFCQRSEFFTYCQGRPGIYGGTDG